MAFVFNSFSNNKTYTYENQENYEEQYQEHQENNQDQEYKQQHYYYNNNISHGAGRVFPKEAGERIREAYIENVCDRMTAAAAKIIEDAYQAGMTIEQIIMAIEDTGLAPRPSPAYLRAILQEWARCGVAVSRSTREVSKCNAKPWWR